MNTNNKTNSSIHKKLNRWSEFKFKNNFVSKNRVVIPPMASGTSDENGLPTNFSFNHYENLSHAGAGIQFVEYTYVHSSGRAETNQMGIQTHQHIENHKKIVDIIKKTNALAGIQLVHVGGKSATAITQQPLLGPSPIAVPVKDKILETPHPLNISEINTYQDWYLQAAIRASEAGYDIIELHVAHGYGLNQWISPITNQRTDLYGGNNQNRSKMLFEIVEKIRMQLPHIILGARIPGEDHFDLGLSPQDMVYISKELEIRGIDFLDVSSGIGGWRRPNNRNGEGYLIPEATFIQNHITIPVIGVGGIETGPFIDEIIESKKVAFAAVGRQILKDPTLFYKQVLER